MKPLLSIIVPVYNAEKYLKRCIDSILHQDYQNFELLLIDDGSTDSSLQICESYRMEDSRIVVIHKENGGLSSARNSGLERVKGEFITFMDSDDEIADNPYSINLEYLLSHPEIDVVQYPCYASYSSPRQYIRKPNEKIIYQNTLMFEAWLQNKEICSYAWNKIYRSNIFADLRYREGIYYEDRYLMCALLQKINGIYLSEQGLYLYYEHSEQITQKPISLKVLESLICADMNIVKTLTSLNILSDVKVRRYFDSYNHYKIMKEKQWSLDKNIFSELLKYKPSVKEIITSSLKIRSKLKLFLCKIFFE